MIRFFEPQDINGLVRLARYHSKELEQDGVLPIDDVYLTRNLRRLLMDSTVQCLVVEEKDEIIGYAIFYLHTKLWNPTLFGQLAFFYILEGARNKYVADQLWNEIIAVCKKSGAQFFESDICAFNAEWHGSEKAIDRASTYFEHKNGDHCGNHYIHRITA
tara:strand:- start:2890 stop:3369 length:480 start_codon:yes stop_codon:yes gene_type:complete